MENISEPIFGVFDGQNMVGDDKKIYPVSANYASKSKLSEGDELKLVIGNEGFIYKQIKRQDTRNVRARIFWRNRECFAEAIDKIYRILLASATYYKLKDEDEVVLLIPLNREVVWATVENVIK